MCWESSKLNCIVTAATICVSRPFGTFVQNINPGEYMTYFLIHLGWNDIKGNEQWAVTFRKLLKYATGTGGDYNTEYPSETQIEPKSRKISFVHSIRVNWPITLKFCTEHGRIKTIRRLQLKLRANESSRDLSLRSVSDGYPILYMPQTFTRQDLTCNSFPCGNEKLACWSFRIASDLFPRMQSYPCCLL